MPGTTGTSVYIKTELVQSCSLKTLWFEGQPGAELTH